MKGELRVGNWYNLKTIYGNQPCKLKFGDISNDASFWEKVSPIALDNAWIEELGFAKNGEHDYRHKIEDWLVLTKCDEGWLIGMFSDLHDYDKEDVLKYVHEFQNAFFKKMKRDLNH